MKRMACGCTAFGGNGNATATDPFVFRNFKSWQLRYGFVANGRSSYAKNLDFYDVTYGFYGQNPHDVRVEDIEGEDIANFIVDVYLRPQGLLTFDGVVADLIDKYPIRITGKKTREKDCEVHLRNVTLTNVEDDLYGVGSEGGNAKESPQLTMYYHDFFGANRDAKIIPSNQSRNDGLSYKELTPPFEDNVKVAEVDVPFPENPIQPIDKLGPASVITWPSPQTVVTRQSDGTLLVRGTTIDANDLQSVKVNNVEVTPLYGSYRQWEVRLPGIGAGEVTLTTSATDIFGNSELNPHQIKIQVDGSTAVREDGAEHTPPHGFVLHANYPNPFNPETTIAFSVPGSRGDGSHITIRVYDVLSRLTRELVNETFSAGEYSVKWTGTDQFGHPAPSGLYFYEMTVSNGSGQLISRQTKKMILSK